MKRGELLAILGALIAAPFAFIMVLYVIARALGCAKQEEKAREKHESKNQNGI